MTKRLRFAGLLAGFAALTLIAGIEYYRRRATEDLYLWQMEVEAKALHSYDRVLKNATLGPEEKVARLSNLTKSETAALVDQMSLMYKIHHRNLPAVWEELSSTQESDLK